MYERTNNNAYQNAIKQACKLIFMGKPISSNKVNHLLKENSWVPTRVTEVIRYSVVYFI